LEAVKKSSEEAMGSAQRELDKFLDSVDGKLLSLSNTAQEFWFKFVDSDVIKAGIDGLNMLLKLAISITDTFGALPTLGLGIGLFAGFKEFKNIKGVIDTFPMMVSSISNLKDNLKSVASLTKDMSEEYLELKFFYDIENAIFRIVDNVKLVKDLEFVLENKDGLKFKFKVINIYKDLDIVIAPILPLLGVGGYMFVKLVKIDDKLYLQNKF
jgi:hypothetical protein